MKEVKRDTLICQVDMGSPLVGRIYSYTVVVEGVRARQVHRPPWLEGSTPPRRIEDGDSDGYIYIYMLLEPGGRTMQLSRSSSGTYVRLPIDKCIVPINVLNSYVVHKRRSVRGGCEQPRADPRPPVPHYSMDEI